MSCRCVFCNALKLPEPESMATTRLRPQALHHNTLPNNIRLYNIKEIYIFFIISALIFLVGLDLALYIAPETILLININ